MKAIRIACLLVFATVLGGCGGGGGKSSSRLEGTWQWTSGTGFYTSVIRADVLVLGDRGLGSAYLLDGYSGLRTCPTMAYVRISDEVLSIAVTSSAPARLYRYEQADDDTLTLTADDGSTIAFVRVPAVPASALCLEPTAMTLTTNLSVASHQLSALGNDGTSLVFTEKEFQRTVRLDPATLTTVGGLSFTTYPPYFATQQGADYWMWSGNNDYLWRKNTASVDVDLLDLAYLEGNYQARYIQGPHWDESTGRMLLLVYNYSIEGHELLVVDSNAEPEALISKITLPFNGRGLAVRGAFGWTISYFEYGPRVVVKFDLATGVVFGSYPLAGISEDYYWHGLTFLGSSLYLVADQDSEQGVLLELEGL